MYHVTVYLDPAAFGRPGPIVTAIDFEVDASSTDEALETTFAVCNSYPIELVCLAHYAPVVAEYRRAGHRSLSVGDRVRVRAPGLDRTFQCAALGWTDAHSPES
jgi:hypothetical protein